MIMKTARRDDLAFPSRGTAGGAWGGQQLPLGREKRFVSVPELGYSFHNCSGKQLSEQTPANSFASPLLPLKKISIPIPAAINASDLCTL